MDDLIVRVLRAVACRTRLRILSYLAGVEEATPSQLAKDLYLRRDLVSAHLARLDSVGLVVRRRSGPRCYCAARSPYGTATLSGQVAGWLYDALRTGSKGQSRPMTSHQGSVAAHDASAKSHGLVFDAATAFTSLRRIQILRRAARGEPVDSPTLSSELRMSETAVSRHLSKLARRGYLELARQRRRLVCKLSATPKTRLHAKLFDIVAAHWGRAILRS